MLRDTRDMLGRLDLSKGPTKIFLQIPATILIAWDIVDLATSGLFSTYAYEGAGPNEKVMWFIAGFVLVILGFITLMFFGWPALEEEKTQRFDLFSGKMVTEMTKKRSYEQATIIYDGFSAAMVAYIQKNCNDDLKIPGWVYLFTYMTTVVDIFIIKGPAAFDHLWKSDEGLLDYKQLAENKPAEEEVELGQPGIPEVQKDDTTLVLQALENQDEQKAPKKFKGQSPAELQAIGSMVVPAQNITEYQRSEKKREAYLKTVERTDLVALARRLMIDEAKIDDASMSENPKLSMVAIIMASDRERLANEALMLLTVDKDLQSKNIEQLIQLLRKANFAEEKIHELEECAKPKQTIIQVLLDSYTEARQGLVPWIEIQDVYRLCGALEKAESVNLLKEEVSMTRATKLVKGLADWGTLFQIRFDNANRQADSDAILAATSDSAKSLNVCNRGVPPLVRAAAGGFDVVCKRFIDMQADPNLKVAWNTKEETAFSGNWPHSTYTRTVIREDNDREINGMTIKQNTSALEYSATLEVVAVLLAGKADLTDEIYRVLEERFTASLVARLIVEAGRNDGLNFFVRVELLETATGEFASGLVNYQDQNCSGPQAGDVVLQDVIMKKQVDAINSLISAKVDVNSKTVLSTAIGSSNEVLKMILEAKADVSAEGVLLDAINGTCHRERIHLDKLDKRYKDWTYDKQSEFENRFRRLDQRLEKTVKEYMHTYAQNSENNVTTLLLAGADANKDPVGLLTAALNKRKKIAVEALLSHIDMAKLAERGDSNLQIWRAASDRNGPTAFVIRLLDAGLVPGLESLDNRGILRANDCEEYYSIKRADWIEKLVKARLNAGGLVGDRGFRFDAYRYKEVWVVKQLLDAKADVSSDDDVATFLESVSYRGRRQDYDGRRCYSDDGILQFGKDHADILQLIIQARANVNSEHVATVLQAQISQEQANILQSIVQARADVNCKSRVLINDGKHTASPLWIAQKMKNQACVDILKKAGASTAFF